MITWPCLNHMQFHSGPPSSILVLFFFCKSTTFEQINLSSCLERLVIIIIDFFFHLVPTLSAHPHCAIIMFIWKNTKECQVDYNSFQPPLALSHLPSIIPIIICFRVHSCNGLHIAPSNQTPYVI